MTQYIVLAPDGSKHIIEGPGPAAPAAQQSPAAAANAAGIQAGQNENFLVAGADQAARQYLPGNVGNNVGAAARYVGQRMVGTPNPDSFATDRAYSGGVSQGEAQGSPLAATAGGVAGGVGQMVSIGNAIGAAGKAIPAVGTVLDALSPATRTAEGVPLGGARVVANLGRAAGANAAIGGATSLINDPSGSSVVPAAIASGIAGPAVGKAADFALSKVVPAEDQAWSALAKVMKTTPQQLQDAIDARAQLQGGAQPSMAQIADLHQQAAIKSLAQDNPKVAAAAITAARSAKAGGTLEQQIQATSPTNMPQSYEQMRAVRNAAMKKAIDPIRDTPVFLSPADQAKLQGPIVTKALRPDSSLAGDPYMEGDPLVDKIAANNLTIGDLDTIREQVRNGQDAAIMAGNKSVAFGHGAAAQDIERITTAASPLDAQGQSIYGNALGAYKNDSRYMTSFMFGRSGGELDAPPADKPMTRAALQTESGQKGFAHGQALYQGEQTLRAIAPGAVASQGTGGMPPIAHAGAALVPGVGPVTKAWHLFKSVVPGLHLPDEAQKIIARQLNDPDQTSQAVANLTRGGASMQDIQRIGAAIGGVQGARIAKYLSGTQ